MSRSANLLHSIRQCLQLRIDFDSTVVRPLIRRQEVTVTQKLVSADLRIYLGGLSTASQTQVRPINSRLTSDFNQSTTTHGKNEHVRLIIIIIIIMKKRSKETQTLRAGGAKNFRPAADPLPCGA